MERIKNRTVLKNMLLTGPIPSVFIYVSLFVLLPVILYYIWWSLPFVFGLAWVVIYFIGEWDDLIR